MFSGLNNFIKIILPKRLFYRALIIVAAPTIILQIIITIVFYDSIWIKANKNTTRALVAQLKTIEEIFKSIKYPAKIIGIEKNRDRKSGINTKANGIKNLKELSKVSE